MDIFDRAVSRKARDALLAQVCARNVPMEVSIVGSEEAAVMRSRFLKAGDRETAEPLVIETPTRSGSSVLVQVGEVLNVLMMVGGQRYGFRSPVRKRGRMKLGDGVEVGILALEYPATIIKLQRRRFFRVKMPLARPIRVKCIAKADDGKGHSTSDDYVRFDADALDISSGGMSMNIPREYAGFAKPANKLALLFRLDGVKEGIRLFAEVRHVREVKANGDVVAGMQFVDWHKNIAGRKAINRITRFVVRRQRIELKKKSGLA